MISFSISPSISIFESNFWVERPNLRFSLNLFFFEVKIKSVRMDGGEKIDNRKHKQGKEGRGAKEKKKDDPTTAKVIAKPKCDTKMKIKAVVTAQYQATDPAKWKRTWKVKKNTGPNC